MDPVEVESSQSVAAVALSQPKGGQCQLNLDPPEKMETAEPKKPRSRLRLTAILLALCVRIESPSPWTCYSVLRE